MHIKYTFAMCQNRVVMPIFRLHFCLLSSAQFEILKFSKMATGQTFEYFFDYSSKTIGDCRSLFAGIGLQGSRMA